MTASTSSPAARRAVRALVALLQLTGAARPLRALAWPGVAPRRRRAAAWGAAALLLLAVADDSRLDYVAVQGWIDEWCRAQQASRCWSGASSAATRCRRA